MKPVIALIGRPNVGKSTLFNQLTKSRNALVANLSGLTRDRQYGDGRLENKSFIAIDTGGLGESDEGIDSYMAEQAKTAIQEADIVLFVVDARAAVDHLLVGCAEPFGQHLAGALHAVAQPDGPQGGGRLGQSPHVHRHGVGVVKQPGVGADGGHVRGDIA